MARTLANPTPTGSLFFRTRTRLVLIAATLVLLIAVPVVVTSQMYAIARSAIQSAQEAEHEAIAVSAARTLATSPDAASLQQLRDAHGLLDAALFNPDGTASLAGERSDVPVSIPQVRYTASGGQRSTERLAGPADPIVRLYVPLRREGDDDVVAVVCLTLRDSLPGRLRVLGWPLEVGLATAALTAAALAVMGVAMRRRSERSRQHLERTARLTTTGMLAASIAHDVRNPLAIILSAAQVVARAPGLTDDHREMMETIVEEVKRADGQLDLFLDLSREMPLRLATEDIAAIVESTVDFISRGHKQVQMSVVRPAGPVFVRVDRRKLRQALVNLLINAATACSRDRSDDQPPRVIVTVQELPDSAAICVNDNGPGIPFDRRDLVFEPFWSTRPDGTGLGLPGARQIIERHGGRLEITPPPGGADALPGATLTIMLPVTPDNPNDPAYQPHANPDRG